MDEAIDAPGEMSPYAPRDHHDQDPGRQDRRGHRPEGQDDQPDPGRHRRRDHHRGRRHDLHRRHRRPVGRGRRSSDQRDRQPDMPEVGERYLGTVVKTTAFGAFVSLLPGKDGLLHISQMRKLAGGKRVENVEDVLNVGEKVQVEIAEIDARGKLSLVPVEVVEREAAAGRGRRSDDGTGRRRTADRADDRPRERPPRRATAARGGRRPRGDGGRATTATRDDRHAAPRHGRCRGRPPHRPARRAAGASPRRCRPCVGARSASGSASARATRRPSSPAPRTSSSTCCSRAPDAAHALEISARDRGGRRRDQRLHRQGVHLLLRAGARRGPAAGHRRRLRHGDLLADHRRRTSRPSAA